MPVELSPSGEKSLRALENSVEQSIDSQALLNGCLQTFFLLERWDTAESHLPGVMDIIELVQTQSQIYYDALRESTSVAQILYMLAGDLKKLIDFLLDPNENNKDIQDYICDMQQYTNIARDLSQTVSKSFRRVRVGLNEITNDIPGEIKRLERQEQSAVVKRDTLERRVRHAKIAKTVSAAALAVVGGVATTVVFPPMMLVLPVALPLAILAVEAFEHHTSKKLNQRTNEVIDCRDGLQQLEAITMCLSEVGSRVDSLIQFWIRSDTMLGTISSGVDRLKGKKAARLRLQTTREHYESAEILYREYIVKLEFIQTMVRSAASSSGSSAPSITPQKDRHHPRDQKVVTVSTDLKRRNAVKSSSRSPPNDPRRA
ncbi:hypothetical protein B0H10DRAFT_2053143 [Mycena sp. CBHHK59/15]|nr:hypothetical protein B0H10DRAFT_2053143 [Mycena sp. CBHHK59/15]